jgi:photosystem II stability/assembly factor-like uncharacterized protein
MVSLGALLFLLGVPSTATGDVVCVATTVKVKGNSLPLGSQFRIRSECLKTERAIINTDLLKGERGATGAKGDTGPQGAKGNTGDRGPTGNDGQQGTQGNSGSPLSWVEVSAATTMQPNLGYIVTGGGEVELTLPSNAAVGDVLQIREGRTPTAWNIVPGATGQAIEGVEGLYAAGNRSWTSIASSGDGSRLAAVASPGYIYTSTDGGRTWTERQGAGQRGWGGIASSEDGLTLVAGLPNQGQSIFISPDGGNTWTERTLPDVATISDVSISVSSGGSKIVVATNTSSCFFISTDSGASWSTQTPPGLSECSAVTSSLDGSKLAAIAYTATDQYIILTSADGGQSWTERTSAGAGQWSDIASSADGSKLVAASDASGYLSTSVDGGATWTTQVDAGAKNWSRVASSQDGSILFAFTSGGSAAVYRSTDSGSTWQRFVRGTMWTIKCSGDGSTLFARRMLSRGGQLLFSSSVDTFNGLKGDGELKLMYLGNGFFGVTS